MGDMKETADARTYADRFLKLASKATTPAYWARTGAGRTQRSARTTTDVRSGASTVGIRRADMSWSGPRGAGCLRR